MQGQLGLEGIPSKLVRVTPARLSTWQLCPRKYRMNYLDRPTPSRSGARANATLGAVVHNALRAYFDLRADQRSPERASALVREHWKSDGFADPEQAADFRGRAQEWVRGYVAELPAGETPLAVERWVSAPVGSIIAEGRVDRIDERHGELVVVDYKTGRFGLQISDARDSLALGLYALAVRKQFHRTCRRVELHHLPSGTVASWEHTAESLAELRDRAEQLAAEFQRAADELALGGDPESLFPVRTGRHCSWCDFRSHCPEGRQAAPDLPSWSALETG
ncbi:PD-(D/E)XK nuclease family protein [Saccharopolyspora sp. WRP15-2]|uniref:PD-(D/E)XK nuclease family protein n=1 Tax=Saccharopolyspora oryzae TaxID=2997343 RepID=A0ABT4UWX4_9PSEU|nr:PD-(D/E)XK nuclease family protein [Saccharopolyspora oryzae]MDA3626216.1 PD-(D/E)XK nuclease family protein [Saccharopolyspora oryzae]